MTSNPIRAVIFDLGGTLEDVYYDDALRLQATAGFRDLLAKYGIHPNLDTLALYAVIKSGMERYKAWREETQQEIPPERLWNEFVFPSQALPKEKLEAAGEDLAFYWDIAFSIRKVRPEAATVLEALKQRGLPLGLISNITSRGMVPCKLVEYGIAQYFSVVVTSSVFHWRKPNARIFYEAARQIGVPPQHCAFVGDTVSRDVSGARHAGYGLAIQMKSFLTTQSDTEHDTEPPDVVIQNLTDIIDLADRGWVGATR